MSEYEPLLRGSFHTLPSSPRKANQMMLMRSGSRYGRGRNRTPLTTLKTASVAPRPSPSVMTAAAAKRGLRRSMRTPYRRSWMKFSSGIGNLPSGAPWPFGELGLGARRLVGYEGVTRGCSGRSEEHTSELQSQSNLVCRLLLEKKKKTQRTTHIHQTRLTLLTVNSTRVDRSASQSAR